MRMVTPDFSEAMVPNTPGTYVCKIVKAEVKVGTQSNLPYVNWKLMTYPHNRIVFHSTPLSGKGAGMFKHFIHSVGDKNYEEGPYDIDKLVGKAVSLKLALDDKNYFVVKEVTPLTPVQEDMIRAAVEEEAHLAAQAQADSIAW